MGVCGLLKAIALQLLLVLLSFIRGEWPESVYLFSSFAMPFICKFDWNSLHVCIINTDTTTLDLQGPIFVHEPAYKVEFSNNTGGHVHCSGHANPYPEVIYDFCFYLASLFPSQLNFGMMQRIRILHNATMDIRYHFFPIARSLDSHNQIKNRKKFNLINLLNSRWVQVYESPFGKASSFMIMMKLRF